ncbi:unnamed protein product [Closterium sp. NIES-53]
MGDAGAEDNLEARLEDARRRHLAGDYRETLPLAVVEAGIRAEWVAEHPLQPASCRSTNTEGGVDVGVNANDQVGSSAGGTPGQRGVIHADEVGGVQARGLQSSMAAGSSKGDVRGRWSSVISASATHVMAGGIAPTYGYFKSRQTRSLEEQMTHLRMGEQETATDYCNRAWRLLANMRMASDQYLTASHITHVLKGLPSSYNLTKRLMVVLGTRESLNEDSPNSYILRDEAMRKAERSTKLLPQANYVALMKQGGQPRQRGKPVSGGSGGGRPANDFNKEKSAKDGGRGGGGRCRECWLCGNPEHLSFECPDHSDSNDDDTKGGQERSAGRRPRWEMNPRKEKQSTKSLTLAKDADFSSSGKGRGDGEASCSLVGVVEPTVSPAPEPTSSGQQKESGVKLQGDGEGMLLVSAAGDVLDRATYTVRTCSTKSATSTTEVVALRAIVSATKSTPARWHVRLVHVGIDTITSSAKHAVTTGLDIKSTTSTDSPCVSCIGGKLARHTFPDKGSDAKDALAVVHIDLCEPFCVAAKDGSLYFMVPKDCKTRYVWVRPVAKKYDVLREFGNKRIIHDLTCLYTPQQNGMAEREIRTVVESVWTMLLHMGVQNYWWHLALRQAIWGWELLDLTDNRVITTSGVMFYEMMSFEVWKSEHGPASGQTQANLPTDTSTATLPLLAEVGELAAEDVEDVRPPSPFPTPPTPPHVAAGVRA